MAARCFVVAKDDGMLCTCECDCVISLLGCCAAGMTVAHCVPITWLTRLLETVKDDLQKGRR